MSQLGLDPVVPDNPAGQSPIGSDVGAAAGDEVGPDLQRTGVESVDAVMDDVDEVRHRPLEEHAAVFESAQERLRHALDAAEPSS